MPPQPPPTGPFLRPAVLTGTSSSPGTGSIGPVPFNMQSATRGELAELRAEVEQLRARLEHLMSFVSPVHSDGTLVIEAGIVMLRGLDRLSLESPSIRMPTAMEHEHTVLRPMLSRYIPPRAGSGSGRIG